MTYPNIDLVIHGMIKHDAGNPKLIQHFLKVHEFARLIGIGEGLGKAGAVYIGNCCRRP